MQVHRGSLTEMREEFEKVLKSKPPETKPKITSAITKSDTNPVKNIMKNVEKEKPVEEKSNINADFIQNEIDVDQNDRVSSGHLVKSIFKYTFFKCFYVVVSVLCIICIFL